jgi:hypothetical protein
MCSTVLVLAVHAPMNAAPAVAAEAPVDCNAKSITVLFWPKGHAAIPKVNFPSFPTPHVEIYKGRTKAYTGSESLGFFDATGMGQFAKSCQEISPPGRALKRISGAKERSSGAAFRCKLKKNAELQVNPVEATGAVRLTAFTAPDKTILTVDLAQTGSAAKYDKKLCKADAAPKP